MFIEDIKISLALQNFFEHVTESSKISFNSLSEHVQRRIISTIYHSDYVRDVLKDGKYFYTFTVSDDGNVRVSKNTLFDLEYRVCISVYCPDQDVSKISEQLSNAFKAGKQAFIDTVNFLNTQYVLWIQSVGNYFKEYDFSNFVNINELIEYLQSLASKRDIIRFALGYIAELSTEQMKEKCVFKEFLIHTKIDILRELIDILIFGWSNE